MGGRVARRFKRVFNSCGVANSLYPPQYLYTAGRFPIGPASPRRGLFYAIYGQLVSKLLRIYTPSLFPGKKERESGSYHNYRRSDYSPLEGLQCVGATWVLPNPLQRLTGRSSGLPEGVYLCFLSEKAYLHFYMQFFRQNEPAEFKVSGKPWDTS